MIQLLTQLKPADNCGARTLRVIHINKGSKRFYGHIGDVVTAVVDRAIPTGIVKDSEVVQVLIVRTKKEFGRKDGTYIRFDDNAGVIIDKTGLPRGTRVFGPIAREIKDLGYSKIVSLAKEVL
jgi:large subunit ribosomal protein L14